MHRNLVPISLLAVALLAPATATADSDSDFLFVTFELGEIIARGQLSGLIVAEYAGATTEAAVSAHVGDTLQGSLSLPASAPSGNWSLAIVTTDGADLLRVTGVVSSDGLQILGSRVDSERIELPPETTSLRIVKGYVSATVTLIGQLKRADCCTATLGIDANADGDIAESETRTVAANGTRVEAAVQLERAAPSVPYVFTITDDGGKVVARASGTYSFTRLNGVSANGEFDPDVVEHVTGSVERVPHLLKHDIGSSILLQTVPGSAREEEGPRVFFTMGTPGAAVEPPAERVAAAKSAAPPETEETMPAAPTPSLMSRTVGLFTSPVYLAILAGSFAAALLAFAARRLMEARGH